MRLPRAVVLDQRPRLMVRESVGVVHRIQEDSVMSVSKERLAELIQQGTDWCRCKPESGCFHQGAVVAFRELAALREGADAGRWVEWREGDAIPADGRYLVRTMVGNEFIKEVDDDWRAVIAYWSIRQPAPFSTGAAHE